MELMCPRLSCWVKDANRGNKCAVAQRYGVMRWMQSIRTDIRPQSVSVSMTDLTVIPLTRGQAIYKIFTLGDYLYMNKHQRIGYLLQGAMQHDWLGFSTECFGDLPVPSCVWNPIPQLEELLQKKKKTNVYLGFYSREVSKLSDFLRASFWANL